MGTTTASNQAHTVPLRTPLVVQAEVAEMEHAVVELQEKLAADIKQFGFACLTTVLAGAQLPQGYMDAARILEVATTSPTVKAVAFQAAAFAKPEQRSKLQVELENNPTALQKLVAKLSSGEKNGQLEGAGQVLDAMYVGGVTATAAWDTLLEIPGVERLAANAQAALVDALTKHMDGVMHTGAGTMGKILGGATSCIGLLKASVALTRNVLAHGSDAAKFQTKVAQAAVFREVVRAENEARGKRRE